MSDKQSVELFSPLSPEDIARKLQAIMADPMTDAQARVYGSGSQYDMTLRYARRNVQNAMAPVLDAAMEPHEGGTRISGTLGKSAAGRLFPLFWFGFLSIFVLIGGALALFVPDALPVGAIFVGIALLMMLIGAIAIRSTGGGEKDRKEILAFLARELDARPMA